MHVKSIEMSLKTAGINVNAIAKVTIVDASDKLVGGATVSGTWSGATSDSDSGVTDVYGKVSLQSNKVKNPTSGTTFTFTVDNVTKDGWTYNQDANLETYDSITVP
jgi:subtilisin